MDVIKPALHLRIAWGHPRDQNDGRIYIYLQTGGTLSSTGGACSCSPQLVVHVMSIGDLQWLSSKCMYMRGFKSCPRQLSLKTNMCTLGELCCVVLELLPCIYCTYYVLVLQVPPIKYAMSKCSFANQTHLVDARWVWLARLVVCQQDVL